MRTFGWLMLLMGLGLFTMGCGGGATDDTGGNADDAPLTDDAEHAAADVMDDAATDAEAAADTADDAADAAEAAAETADDAAGVADDAAVDAAVDAAATDPPAEN